MPAPTPLRAVPTAPADPARGNLRAAIDDLAQAHRSIQHAEHAHRRVHAQHMDRIRRHGLAETALREAESTGQRARIDHLLAPNSASEARNLEDLRRDVDTASAAVRAAAEDDRLLEDEARRRQQAHALCVIRRTEQIASVLKPTAEGLLARVHELRQQAADIEHALAALPAGTLPPFWASRRQYTPNSALAHSFTATVSALETDADASIPEDIHR